MTVSRDRRIHGLLHFLALMSLVCVTTLQVPVAQPLSDAFQEAEYATFGFLAKTLPDFRMPVLIHGGLDVLPSYFAASLCPSDHQIICVRGINEGIQVLSAGLFVTALALLTGLGSVAALLASLPAAAVLWLYDGPVTTPVDAHQGTPSVRDLFVVGAVSLMAGIARRLDEKRTFNGGSLALLGALASCGIFWAYNRGLVLLFSVGLFAAGLSIIRRSSKPLMLIGAGAVAAFITIIAAGGFQLITETMFNIRYWSANAEIWHLPFQLQLAAPTMMLVAVALIAAVFVGWQCLRSARPSRTLMLVVLSATCTLYLIQAINRPDLAHLRPILWLAALILAVVVFEMTRATLNNPMQPSTMRLALLLMVVGSFIEFASENSIQRRMLAGLRDNVRMLTQTLPSDQNLVPPGIVQASTLISKSGGCTFAADNAGIVYLLAKVAPCSRFAYGAYVAPTQQEEVIAALAAMQPKIILWDTSEWYGHIDGRNLTDRNPVLANWIAGHYSVQTIVGNQILLSQIPLNTPSAGTR